MRLTVYVKLRRRFRGLAVSEPNCKNPHYYDPGTDEHRAGRPSPPITTRFPARGRLARAAKLKRLGLLEGSALTANDAYWLSETGLKLASGLVANPDV